MDSIEAARMPLSGPRCAVAALVGALACLFVGPPATPMLGWALVACGLVVWWMPGRWAWAGALLVGFAWTGCQVHTVQRAWLPEQLEGRVLQISGVVEDLPVQEDGRRSFLFRVDDTVAEVALRGQRVRLGWYAKPGEALPAIAAGARWQLRVKLKRPHGLRNPGTLDAERSAFARRVVANGTIVRGPDNREVAKGQGIEAVRDRLGARIGNVGPPAARFIRALAVGDTRGIREEDWKILRANGLTHLIAISGSHVAMAAMLGVGLAWLAWRACPGLGLWLPRRVALPLAGAAVAIGYTLLAGSEVPTLRTLLMMWCAVGAWWLRRRLGVTQALSAAALTLLVVDPLTLLKPGFWLSFAGVAVLAIGLHGVRRGWFAELAAAQAVATIGLLPLCVLFFGQTSWVAPLANLLAVPLWGLVIVPLSLMGVALAGIHPPAADLAWSGAAHLFDASWPAFETMAAWPGAEIQLPEARPWAVLLACAGALWCLMPRGMPLRRWSVCLWLPLLLPNVPRAADRGLVVTFLDVGQGLSVLVQTRRHALLYDAGPKGMGGYDAGEKAVLPALAALGVARLDLLMLSHGDADHAGGAPAVVKALAPKDIQAPAGAPVVYRRPCARGQSWTWDGVQFDVLAPSPVQPYAGNASSCVLRVRSAHGTVLLTGDIEAAGEAALVAANRAALKADVVSMPHHGSNSSSTYPFVRATGARHVVASSGYRNLFRHPRGRVWDRWRAAGAVPHNTPASGALRFEFDAHGITVTSERARRARLWDTMRGNGVDGRSGLSYGKH